VSGTQPLLSVRGLATRFRTFGGVVPAVDGVSFELASGEIMGLVGESGGGKSMVGFSIMGLVDPPGRIEAGEILFEGRDLARLSEREMKSVRGARVAMIFQDPMTALNPLYTIGEQLDEMLRLHTDLDRTARRERCIAMLDEVGIPQPAERLGAYPHQFSGGMRQRVVIAIAMIAGPRLLIADEPTTALDVTIQAQLLRLMQAQVRRRDAALILITHDLAAVSQIADRVVVLYCGRVAEAGPAAALVAAPRHPYTSGLVASIPGRQQNARRLTPIPGAVPDIRSLPPGCAFAPRCPRAADRCRVENPAAVPDAHGRVVACHYPLGEDATA
jgi:peptide/nickel transport system ATP-binding protein